MNSQFVPTVTNMVTSVRNIIDGYNMGPIRALAQEPVQNSKDAAQGNPYVEYRLQRRLSPDGESSYILTVTDSSTSGLGGPVLSLGDIQARGNVLRSNENWAAFEGMGYTKEDESALGSRGQGKAAFLYHSIMPRLTSSTQDRMMILYDTLLPNSEYRLGVRYASPFDTVLAPPFLDDEARRIVSSRYTSEDGTEVELGLTPLTSVGTRVIVPHLSQVAVDAFHSGELYRWLQRCWWRAIQIGLTIVLVDEQGNRETVSVPSWWQNQPWNQPSATIRNYEDIDVGGGHRIKRIVLLYDESLTEVDIPNASPQFLGVQLLRGQQWIETLAQELFEYIPRDKRLGFRGFVEFDRGAERELRREENPQHEKFFRWTLAVRDLIDAIHDKVREFSQDLGWTQQQRVQAPPSREQDAAMEFLRFFNPRARRRTDRGNGKAVQGQLPLDGLTRDHWSCHLNLQFPNSQTSRVDWGDQIREVTVGVNVAPPNGSRRASVRLHLTPDADPTARLAVTTQDVEIWEGVGQASFGNFQIIRGATSHGQLKCAQSGKWKLTAEVQVGGSVVSRDSRSFYVQQDPPIRDSNPYTLSISSENTSRQQLRIDSGDTLGLQVSVKNQTLKNIDLEVTASLGDLLLADRQSVSAEGTPLGAAPRRIAAVQKSIVVNPPASVTLKVSQVSALLPAGPHQIHADLYVAGGRDPAAHAVKTVYVDEDPARRDDWPPFNIEQIEGGPHPRWQFIKRSSDDWTLQFPAAYPLYEALNVSSENGRRGRSGAAFVVDVCAEGLVEWALSPTGNGDETRLDDLLTSTPAGTSPEEWEALGEKMQALAGMLREPVDWSEITRYHRECAALMLAMYEERA